jgi:hypothetical protein
MHSFEVSLGYESVDRSTFWKLWPKYILEKCTSVNAFIPQRNFKRMHSILKWNLNYKFNVAVCFWWNIWIERGRYEGLKVEDIICNTCFLNIEDEFHFLMICSPLDNCRAKYFNIIKRLYTNFENLSTEDKFIWLLSCEDKEIIFINI